MIKYTMQSENSTDHWPYFDIKNHNVLDLGCGRWYTKETNEFSPIYFKNMGANKVIGVDGNDNDIEFYKNLTTNDPSYVFICKMIQNINDVKELLNTYSITALKSDIEGGEIVLLDLTKEDLINIKELAIEFHTEDLKQSFIKKIEEWGFVINVEANFANTPSHLGVLFCSKIN